MKNTSDARLWLFVAIVFGCLATAYVFAFRAAHQAQIREVPLAKTSAHP